MLQKTKFAVATLAIIFLLGCNATNQSAEDWKSITIGYNVFDFPGDFELITEKGIDSYVGKIKNDSMQFTFDFGMYTNSLEKSPEEYLQNGSWREDLSLRFMEDGVTYNQNTLPKVKVLLIRPATLKDSLLGKGCDYVANCQHAATQFNHPIYLPNEIKQLNFLIDTVDHHYKKVVWTKAPIKGAASIYLKKLNSDNLNAQSLALSMYSSSLTAKQQEMALKIFKSVRVKNK